MNTESLSEKAKFKIILEPSVAYTESEAYFPCTPPTSILTLQFISFLHHFLWHHCGDQSGLTVEEMAQGKDFRLFLSRGALKDLMREMTPDDRLHLQHGKLRGFGVELSDCPHRSDFVNGVFIQRIFDENDAMHSNASFEDLAVTMITGRDVLAAARFRRVLDTPSECCLS